MRFVAAVPVLLVSGFVLSATSVAQAADKDHDRLDKGEVIITPNAIPGSSIPEVTLRAVINAPPESVWFIVDQCSHYKDTMPRIKESQELSRVGTTVRCRVVLNSPGPVKDLVAVTVADHHIVPDQYWIRAWKLESGDYKVNVGSWTLSKFDDNPKRTLVVYRDHSEPTIWVPDWVQNYAVKKGLPMLIDKFRQVLGVPVKR